MNASSPAPKEHTTGKTSATIAAQKKLIAALIFALLAVLLLLIIVLVKVAQKSNIAQRITTSTKPNVNPKKEYENPFNKKTQYINPFSDYKNPFDNLE